MKNRIFGLILVFVLSISCLPVSAQTYNLQDLGVSYNMPDTWQQIQGEGAMFTYVHKDNQAETISIAVGDVPGINDVSEYPLDQLEKLCSDALSDNNIAQMYAQATGLNIYVEEDEVSKKYAHWNTNNFYTYEKFFYIWTDGVAKEKMYHSLFVSFNAGKISNIFLVNPVMVILPVFVAVGNSTSLELATRLYLIPSSFLKEAVKSIPTDTASLAF